MQQGTTSLQAAVASVFRMKQAASWCAGRHHLSIRVKLIKSKVGCEDVRHTVQVCVPLQLVSKGEGVLGLSCTGVQAVDRIKLRKQKARIIATFCQPSPVVHLIS